MDKTTGPFVWRNVCHESRRNPAGIPAARSLRMLCIVLRTRSWSHPSTIATVDHRKRRKGTMACGQPFGAGTLQRIHSARYAGVRAGSRRRRKYTTLSRWQMAAPMMKITSCRCASLAIRGSPPRKADVGPPEGAPKSQIELHHIAGPPLRVNFRAFKKGILYSGF